MKLKGLLCFVARHRWVPSEKDAAEGVLILECSRCGREEELSGAFEMKSWLERREVAEWPFTNPGHTDPRIHERRRR